MSRPQAFAGISAQPDARAARRGPCAWRGERTGSRPGCFHPAHSWQRWSAAIRPPRRRPARRCVGRSSGPVPTGRSCRSSACPCAWNWPKSGGRSCPRRSTGPRRKRTHPAWPCTRPPTPSYPAWLRKWRRRRPLQPGSRRSGHFRTGVRSGRAPCRRTLCQTVPGWPMRVCRPFGHGWRQQCPGNFPESPPPPISEYFA